MSEGMCCRTMRNTASCLLLSSVLLVGCKVTATYKPPSLDDLTGEYSAVIDKPFGETWNALIEYAARTYFGIENFERDSGLLVLSFGVATPSEFVTGGEWTYDDPRSNIKFKGDYVTYLHYYHGGALSAKMNVVVSRHGESKTRVVVNTRYVFSAIGFTSTWGGVYRETWTFNSGSYATIKVTNPVEGTPAERTLRPTHKAEWEMIEAIKNF